MTSLNKINECEPMPQNPKDSAKWLTENRTRNADFWAGKYSEMELMYLREREQHQLTQEHLSSAVQNNEKLRAVLLDAQKHASKLDDLLLNQVPF